MSNCNSTCGLIKALVVGGTGGAALLVAYATLKALNNKSGRTSGGRFQLAEKVWPRLVEYMNGHADAPSVEFREPAALRAEFAKIGCPLPMGDVQSPTDMGRLEEVCQAILDFSVRSGSPLFNNQLYGASDPVGILGGILDTVINASNYTYEAAPVTTLMEFHVLEKIAKVLGGEFANKHDGIFLPGGSVANTYAMHLARFSYEPKTKELGNAAAPKLVAFTSDVAHYSYLKATNMLGLGTSQCVKIPTDQHTGAMIPEALRAAIQQALNEGKQPFFVGATAGTTVLGSFDPFHSIADIVRDFNKGTVNGGPGRIWLHVDGAWGGACLFSTSQRHLLAGAERGDSFSWNPHKAMGTPQQCTTLITKHAGTFSQANGSCASYLFQPDKENASLDLGDRTLQCGRKTDALKIWLQWKAIGDEGLTRRIEHLFDLVKYMGERIATVRDEKGRRCFKQVAPTSFTNLCFYFIPPSMRTSKTSDPLDSVNLEALARVAPKLKSRMQRNGKALIGFQPIRQYPNCWRMVFSGAKEDIMSHRTVDEILQSMMDLGRDL